MQRATLKNNILYLWEKEIKFKFDSQVAQVACPNECTHLTPFFEHTHIKRGSLTGIIHRKLRVKMYVIFSLPEVQYIWEFNGSCRSDKREWVAKLAIQVA
jgi:hypothetical protein